MKQRLLILSLFLFLFSLSSFSQDTIRVMQYNLMFYGYYTDFCNSFNNNTDQKDEYLRTIIEHLEPDILAVNELGRGPNNSGVNLQRLRDNVFNTEGNDYFEHATYTNTGGGWFANGLLYDTRKFGLAREAIVNTLLRDINLYQLYYKSDDLALTGDTVFLTVLVAHLKAGQSASDQQTRTAMINSAMNYLSNNGWKGNILFVGDFNMRHSAEQAYQLMTAHSNADVRFYDPINITGQWGRNPDMAPYHTQSPRTGSHDCFVTGGLDDRYDFILATRPIMEGTAGFEYVLDSYQAVGQDGLRYNQSLMDPPNYSQPQALLDALYNMSDHLPVLMDMVAVSPVTNVSQFSENRNDIKFQNPARNQLDINLYLMDPGNITISILNTDGSVRLRKQKHIPEKEFRFEIDIADLTPGIYIIRILLPDGSLITDKLLKL